MKKLLFLLFAGICLPFSVTFGQQHSYVQEQQKQLSNFWGLKSWGVYANFGSEKFFKPLTFDYFSRNSGNPDPQYFMLPPGGGTSQTRPMDDVMGGGIELAWPVGKKHNELRAGLSIQDHRNSLSATSRYNIDPDTIRLHTIDFKDYYLMSQASLDYVFYSKPILKHFRFLCRVGSTFGVSTPTKYKYEIVEKFTDIHTDYVFTNPDGSFGYNRWQPNVTHREFTDIESSPRLEAGFRSSVGLEFMLDIFHQEFGISYEYGHGLAGQKVLKGGTSDLKRTKLGHIQIRFFLN